MTVCNNALDVQTPYWSSVASAGTLYRIKNKNTIFFNIITKNFPNMNLLEDPLKNNPDRSEIRSRCNDLLSIGLSNLLKSEDFESRKQARIIIDTALLYKYGPGHFTVKFRQTDIRNNDEIEKLINKAILDL